MCILDLFDQGLFGRVLYEDSNSAKADMVAKFQDKVLGKGLIVQTVTEDMREIPKRV